MHFTGILRDTLKEEACVVPTTFSDFKKVDHKSGKLGLSEVSFIGYHVPYCVWDYNQKGAYSVNVAPLAPIAPYTAIPTWQMGTKLVKFNEISLLE